jgi:hypothetical protein
MELFPGSGRKCWSGGAGNQDQFPANRGFRALAGCQQRRRSTKTTKSGYGHPEATPRPPRGHPQAIWWPTGRHPEATLRLPRGYPEATPRLPRGYPEATPRLQLGSHASFCACWQVIYALPKCLSPKGCAAVQGWEWTTVSASPRRASGWRSTCVVAIHMGKPRYSAMLQC